MLTSMLTARRKCQKWTSDNIDLECEFKDAAVRQAKEKFPNTVQEIARRGRRRGTCCEESQRDDRTAAVQEHWSRDDWAHWKWNFRGWRASQVRWHWYGAINRLIDVIIWPLIMFCFVQLVWRTSKKHSTRWLFSLLNDRTCFKA